MDLILMPTVYTRKQGLKWEILLIGLAVPGSRWSRPIEKRRWPLPKIMERLGGCASISPGYL